MALSGDYQVCLRAIQLFAGDMTWERAPPVFAWPATAGSRLACILKPTYTEREDVLVNRGTPWPVCRSFR